MVRDHLYSFQSHQSLICVRAVVNINVTKPCQTLIRLRVTKSTLLKCILLPHISTALSLRPSARLSLSIPPPSLYLTSRSPEAPPHRPTPPIPLSPRSHSFSPPLSPLFLSIHTTESLLIICDLLKYIHCHSLSLPLSSLLSLSLSLPGLLFSNLLALLTPSLILSLGALSVPFVFPFCRIICVPFPPSSPRLSSSLSTPQKSQTRSVRRR